MLVGLHGESRAGKDSVAAVLVRKYGFTQIALATAIRDILLDLDPWVGNVVGDGGWYLTDLYDYCEGDWDLIKAQAPDSVEWMIKLGQSARNVIGEDVWINAAFPDGYRHTHAEGHVVISDIRQPNEVEFLHRWGGELWKVERPGTSARGMDSLLKGVRFDAHIVNDGTLDDLEDTVSWIIEQDWPG